MIKINLERGIKELKAYLIFRATGEEKKRCRKISRSSQRVKRTS